MHDGNIPHFGIVDNRSKNQQLYFYDPYEEKFVQLPHDDKNPSHNMYTSTRRGLFLQNEHSIKKYSHSSDTWEDISGDLDRNIMIFGKDGKKRLGKSLFHFA